METETGRAKTFRLDTIQNRRLLPCTTKHLLLQNTFGGMWDDDELGSALMDNGTSPATIQPELSEDNDNDEN